MKNNELKICTERNYLLLSLKEQKPYLDSILPHFCRKTNFFMIPVAAYLISYNIIWYINIIDLVKGPSAICGLVVSPKRRLQGQAGIMILCQAVSSHPFFNIITFFFY